MVNGYAEIVLKHAPWSISKVNVLNQCGKQYFHKYVEKLPEGKKADASRVGVVAHAVIETGLRTPGIDLHEVLRNQCESNQLSREEILTCSTKMVAIEDFLGRVDVFKKNNGVIDEFIEHQLAISPTHEAVSFKLTADSSPNLWRGQFIWRGDNVVELVNAPLIDHAKYSPYATCVVVPKGPFRGTFDVVEVGQTTLRLASFPPTTKSLPITVGDVIEGGITTKPLLRGVIDHAMRTNDDFLIVLDHKSGKKKPIGEHATQFYAYMALAIVNFPWVRGIQSGIHYIGEPKVEWFPRFDGTSGAWTREEIIRIIFPWLRQYLNRTALKLELIDAGTPKVETGWQCSFCGFSESCEQGQIEIKKRAQKKGEINV
jgi:CRISPR/Cas system-associated exonuclease Cas4 (RecB family)